MKFCICIKLLFVAVIISSCQPPSGSTSSEKFKSELFAVEKEFCAMAQTSGVQTAFVFFAADSAVIQRQNLVLKGKASISRQYASFPKKGTKLEWTPDFAEASASGDLGYTYGKYTLTTTDSTGRTTKSSGIFHTVWKRQPDGQWRFVWD